MLQERANFAIALSNQRDYGYVRRVMARHGAQQGALSDAAAAENSHALSRAHGSQRIDGADAGEIG